MSGDYEEMMVFEQIENLTRDLKNSYAKEISELRQEVVELKNTNNELNDKLKRMNGNE